MKRGHVGLVAVALLAVVGAGLRQWQGTAARTGQRDEATVLAAVLTQAAQASADGALATRVGLLETRVAVLETQAAGDLASPAASPAGSPGATPALSAAGCWTEAQRLPDVAGRPRWSAPPAMVIDPAKAYAATITTTLGVITVELFPGDVPITVNNFVCLARAGYYDQTPVHRVVAGFLIQAGDPTGTGTGGPGYRFDDEPFDRDYEPGMVAMANAGPDTNGSQFFIVLAHQRGVIAKTYTIFGRVTSGQETVDAIAATAVRAIANGEASVPVDAITIEQVTIAEG